MNYNIINNASITYIYIVINIKYVYIRLYLYHNM